MGKRLLVFAIIFLSLLAFTLWRAQPPFRLQRKLLAKLPYSPDKLLVTDLDDDGHPEVTALQTDNPPIWVRFPFDKPSLLRFKNYRAVWVQGGCFVLKALPVLTMDDRLRLLRWKEGKAKLDPLPSLPDVPMDDILVGEGKGTGTVFLRVDQGNNCWLFTLTPQGEWQFASQFKLQFAVWNVGDLADLDGDGLLDALFYIPQPSGKDAWVLWGGQEKGETNLGSWTPCGSSPKVADLDGDGWMEIVIVTKDGRLKIWGFDRRERRLKVIATSPPLPGTLSTFYLDLFDLDGDRQKEVVVADAKYWIFRWRDGKLKMWQKMWQGKTDLDMWHLTQVKFGDRLALYTYQYHPIWLFPPRIWMEDWKLRWQFKERVQFTVFCLLPKGEQALSPSHWRFQEAPFQLKFAGDIDGDGSDEVIGYDVRWRCWRLYRVEVTRAGELRWRDVLLGREKIEPTAFALLVDGKRRGLVVAWSDGRLELLTMEGKK